LSLRAARPETTDAAQLAAGRSVGALFEEHGTMVHALCRWMLRDPAEAEDATQQTFLAAYRSLLAGTQPVDARAWLATIARNECKQRFRRKQVDTVAIDESTAQPDDVATVVERREEMDALAAALSDLTPAQRDAVILREFYGLSYAEVGAVLGISGPAVESLLFKGRRRLQLKLRPLRSAGAALVPLSLRDALAQALPGFGASAAAAGGAKVAVVPVAAKFAAVAVLLAGGGATVAGSVERDGSHARRQAHAAAAPADSARAESRQQAAYHPPVAWAAPLPPPRHVAPTPSRVHRAAAGDDDAREDDEHEAVAHDGGAAKAAASPALREHDDGDEDHGVAAAQIAAAPAQVEVEVDADDEDVREGDDGGGGDD
jgi:RNA polymerase sigma-70 factor (ECF subfamily)